MARPTTEERLARVHADALAEFDQIQSVQRDVREQCLAARRFYAVPGAQWEGGLGDQFENKPRFEVNRTHLAVLRIINEYRNNRITVDFTSRDGTENDQLADTCDGLYRADEQASNAQEAYDTCFEEGTAGGMGAFRLRACYEDDEDEENNQQRVMIEPIHDADSTVFFDLDAKRQDKADAQRCYVLQPYTYAAYTDEFGDDPATWPKGITDTQFDWCTPDIVWVCELYRVEESKEMVYWYRSKIGGVLGYEAAERRYTQSEIDDDPGLTDRLQATGFELARQKRVARRRVHKYILSGAGVLVDCGFIAGNHIPIIPYYGKRLVIDGTERFIGHVHLAMDAQRLTNMLMSWLAELAARFDVEKPILTPEQVAGHAQRWADDAIKRYPYLLLNAVIGADGNPLPPMPVAYTKAPNVPPAMGALLQIATEALNDLLGGQQAGEQLQPNLSGKAVELIQQRLDMQTFIYCDNFAKAMRRAGEVWLSMKKEITYEPSRRMKTVAMDGKPGSVVVNEPRMNKAGEEYLENDISKATFDVVPDVGPSSNSRRAAMVRALSGLAAITDDPEIKQALTFATIANLEGEGLADLRDWGRQKSIRMGIVKPNEEEQQQLAQEQAQEQPDAQTQYLQASAAEALAKADKARADTLKAAADAKKAEAETAATLAGIGTERQQQVVDTMKTLHEITKPEPAPKPAA